MTTTLDENSVVWKMPKHKCGLYLEHNPHKDIYSSVEEYTTSDMYTWKNDDAKNRAIVTDELWILQWYPDTPIGFILIAAPSLKELLDFAMEDEEC